MNKTPLTRGYSSHTPFCFSLVRKVTAHLTPIKWWFVNGPYRRGISAPRGGGGRLLKGADAGACALLYACGGADTALFACCGGAVLLACWGAWTLFACGRGSGLTDAAGACLLCVSLLLLPAVRACALPAALPAVCVEATAAFFCCHFRLRSSSSFSRSRFSSRRVGGFFSAASVASLYMSAWGISNHNTAFIWTSATHDNQCMYDYHIALAFYTIWLRLKVWVYEYISVCECICMCLHMAFPRRQASLLCEQILIIKILVSERSCFWVHICVCVCI